MNNYHVSVLLQEVIDLLDIQEGAKYIDSTIGGGGHSFEILKRGGKVLGLDVDYEALAFIEEKVKTNKDITLVKGNFKDIKKIAVMNGFEKVSGIIFDLGVSSRQFDTAERGFSFRYDGPLDMRMDKELNVQAKDLLNILSKNELYELFTKLGEEPFARTIANRIVKSRAVTSFQTTKQLFEIIKDTVRYQKLEKDTAARIYQALRIAVNDELNNLRSALPDALDLIDIGGKIAVISFHSLEDRIVKNQFNTWQEKGRGKILTKKPVRPSIEEIKKNNRARSAKLRAFQKN